MAGTITVLDMPVVSTLEDSDVLYLIRGSGVDRDKSILGSTLKSYLGDILVTVTATGAIDLSTYTSNVVVNCDPSAGITITFTGALPGGSRLFVVNPSAYDVDLSIESTTPTLTPGMTYQYISDSTNMIKMFGMLDEDDMVSDSNTDLPTQQSVKAYVDSSVQLNIKTVTTSPYTITDADMENYDLIEFDTTLTAITATLADLASNYGKKIILKHSVRGSTNTVTINRAGSDEITNDQLTSIELPIVGNFMEILGSSITGYWEIFDESIACQLRLYGHAGYGSTDTAIRRFSTKVEYFGNMFTQNHDSGYNGNTEGLEITIARSGKYAFNHNIQTTGVISNGLSVDSSQLTTAIVSINNSDVLSCVRQGSSGVSLGEASSATVRLNKNQIVRAHGSTGTPADPVIFSASYLGQ
jgi:hypothetical protein